MPSTLFRDYLEMVGFNEPITKKAQFWTSYVKTLQGNLENKERKKTRKNNWKFSGKSDIRAQEKKCSGDSFYAAPHSVRETVTAPGYKYIPLYNNIYGLTPRNIEKVEVKQQQRKRK